MLVLSRKERERVVLTHTCPDCFRQEHIIVTMMELRGDKARLGFQAEKNVKIYREEVQQRVDPLTLPDILAKPERR